MKGATTSKEKQGFFSLERRDDIALLKLGKNFLFESMDLSISSRLFDVIDLISENDAIKALAFINCPEKIACEEYIDFCRHTIATEFDCRSIQIMCNVFDQLIVKIVGLNKVTVHADCDHIIPLFLNLSLACDYRIVASHTIFQKPYFELGLLPKGGGPFFLCNLLGQRKAREILMSDEDINALEALELGIVDQVVPYHKLEESAIQVAQRLAKLPIQSLVGIKRLINYSMKDLVDYLGFESQELLKTLGAP
ncbi:MAG: enoyl-CoA hydratase/isomerase family protein [Desulfobacterales bacterium]|jgi:2-(1,2-epoxy-1,2-dihydrophenyl)acetyl-CoA isomerase